MNASVTGQLDSSTSTGTEPLTASTAHKAFPLRSESFDTPAHNRHLRLAGVLEGCSERPAFLFHLVGVEKIAETLSIPPATVERMIVARASVRVRLAKRVRKRLGLSGDHLEAARRLPDDPQELLKAVLFFAVAIRVAGVRRVMPRATFQALNHRYGVDAVAFGMSRQTLLGPHADILSDYVENDTPSNMDLRLFVRSLAASGHSGAAIVALKLGLPVALATAKVADIELARETGLPEVALAALELISKRAMDAVSAADEAAWQSDASEDVARDDPSEDGAPDLEPSSPDSTEAA